MDIGDIGLDIETISFWMKPDSLTEDVIDLDGGTYTISIVSGVVMATGFVSPSTYVNAVANALVSTDWKHILIATDTVIDVNDLDIARISAGYFDGQIDELRMYNYILTDSQIKINYNDDKVVSFN